MIDYLTVVAVYTNLSNNCVQIGYSVQGNLQLQEYVLRRDENLTVETLHNYLSCTQS